MNLSLTARLAIAAVLLFASACAAAPSPVQATPSAPGGVVINEILAHTDPPLVDTVELHNPSNAAVDIGGWFLSDDEDKKGRFRVPDGVILPGGGYYLFRDTDLGFGLSEFGETLSLYRPDSQGKPGALADQCTFGVSPNGRSLGRHVDSTGRIHYPLQSAVTLGTANTGPLVGPLVISEIMYHPTEGGEYVVVTNVASIPAPLYDPAHPENRWKLAGIGDDNGTYTFPAGLILGPGASLVVSGDPDAYRAAHGNAVGVPVVGPFDGKLSNEGERLALQQPQPPETDPDLAGFVAYADMDFVSYGVTAPWPAAANGQGAALVRVDGRAFGSDPANWQAGRQELRTDQLAYLPLVAP
jgi:hypothetical protein